MMQRRDFVATLIAALTVPALAHAMPSPTDPIHQSAVGETQYLYVAVDGGFERWAMKCGIHDSDTVFERDDFLPIAVA
jgi:hypothetical protein